MKGAPTKKTGMRSVNVASTSAPFSELAGVAFASGVEVGVG
jgi:hypothetical protein